MKQLFKPVTMIITAIVLFFSSCKKDIHENSSGPIASADNFNRQGHLRQTKTYSSEVPIDWLTMQLRILKVTTVNIFGLNSSRYFSYCGVALYESVNPGMPSYRSLATQLNQMPAMPSTLPGQAYHWPTSANAALAYMNKHFFSTTTPANLASMDSLENALNAVFQTQVDAAEFARSQNFGRAVAALIFSWALTDGFNNATPYTPPVGPGLWAPTFPAFAPAAGPYWGTNRILVPGSLTNTSPPPPPPYSENPASAWYALEKEVYDVSQSLTPAEIAQAIYYRDIPGFVAGSHYISIFKQVLEQSQPSLAKTAVAYAKSGIAICDAAIGCFISKYSVNRERPIRYIREVLGHPAWLPLFNTPNHPDYPSGHSTLGGAAEVIWTELFGKNYHLVNHTYDYLGLPPRTYHSFSDMIDDVSRSRVLAGIHTSIACNEGRIQGNKIATNINHLLRFRNGEGNDDGDHDD